MLLPQSPMTGRLLPFLGFLLTGSSVAGISQALTDDVTDDGRTGHDEGSDLGCGCLGLAQRHHQHGDKGRDGLPLLCDINQSSSYKYLLSAIYRLARQNKKHGSKVVLFSKLIRSQN